ncbi:LOW QUALITY PROTEIN: Integrase, catalytic core protein [Phytophthora megakarya]|uniref:Integrase, catalytic core protein n=1 Tax=Phytophthora megakarya TaxID=4795 RepID=A0A225W3V2_9STRA|nr:LOW QUALITY PROTEIN: Integrase, catalytic core protein [Phytophthora megakarya]
MIIDSKLSHARWEYAVRHAISTPCALESAFVGFENERKGIHAYSRLSTPRIRNTRFFKLLGRQYATEEATRSQELGDEDDAETDEEEFADAEPWGTDGNKIRVGAIASASGDIIIEPRNVAEAKRSKQWSNWKQALERELQALEDNEIEKLMDYLWTALDNTVHFRVKVDAQGTVIFKVRVCARGDRQFTAFDPLEVYAPVATLSAIRLTFAMTAKFGLQLCQVDVPSPFLEANLKKPVYLKQARGFEKLGKETHVRKLKRHCTACAKREPSDKWRLALSCSNLNTSRQMHLHQYEYDCSAHLGFYVDDILLAYNDVIEMKRGMDALVWCYNVKQLSVPSKFLGMEVKHGKNGTVFLSQNEQIDVILHRFGMEQRKASHLPIAAGTRLEKSWDPATQEEVKYMADVPYRQLVGAQCYVSRMTRPDTSFAVTQTAQRCTNPDQTTSQNC